MILLQQLKNNEIKVGEYFMPWNKLDGTRVNRQHPTHRFPHHPTPPAVSPQQQIVETSVQKPQKKFRISILLLTVFLMIGTVMLFPEIPFPLIFVVGIACYSILQTAIPAKAPPALEKPEEPKKIEEETSRPKVEKEEKPIDEVEKIITDGRLYLDAIKKLNRKISNNDPNISVQITRMEESIEKIFDYISEHPEDAPQIRKFMNYYLPTLLKLLNSYDTLKQQGIQGDNINATLTDIEGILHTMAVAFEKQLDNLFADDALDISADIAVLKNMLAQEGLTDDGLNLSAADNSNINLTL